MDCCKDCRAACGREEAALEARTEQHATGRKGRESLSRPFSRWAIVLGLRLGHRPTDRYFIGRLGAGATVVKTHSILLTWEHSSIGGLFMRRHMSMYVLQNFAKKTL
jgi:hypothetical protein